ncbi:hypothetical protein O181_079873 [Austropuccinia psidii MF-1]|uniref:Uncharacterized protein n=1 Tax=Austropuccinia psidii MF-1 TaxID=1389203 RepID=A0A9Q3IG14_9BASI|nr:hypothetical protein [Austropuccinia psidii MF-1]
MLMLHWKPSQYAFMAAPHIFPHPSANLPLNMLMLLLHPQDMTPTLSSPLIMLPPTCLILSAAYHPYAHVVPSRYSSNAALTPPYPSSHQPNSLCLLPSLCS